MGNNLDDKDILAIFATKLIILMNGDQAERLPQKDERRNEDEGGILESASTFAQGVLKEIEALAGTAACKSVQLVRLKRWALEQGCWFNNRNQFGDFFDRGSENEVYLSPDGTEIIKLNDFRYSDDNLTPFFERIKAHNKYFDACPYRMIGFAENRDGHICAVLVQPFIAEARLATEQEIHDEFIRLGFHAEDNGGYYTNDQHDIFDAVDGNVLVDDDGHFFFSSMQSSLNQEREVTIPTTVYHRELIVDFYSNNQGQRLLNDFQC